jgi:hypothetical protein
MRGEEKVTSQNKISQESQDKRGRGRPRHIDCSIVVGQADHYRTVLHQFWPKLGPRLLAAQSPEEIVKAVREDAAGIAGSLMQFSELIRKILHDPKFPHARLASQVHFLSDSLGGRVL